MLPAGQLAYGRAKRTHTEFGARHGLRAAGFESPAAGLPSQGASGFVSRAVEAVAEADRIVGELQDSMLPVEAGDEELRAGLKAVREPPAPSPGGRGRFCGGSAARPLTGLDAVGVARPSQQ